MHTKLLVLFYLTLFAEICFSLSSSSSSSSSSSIDDEMKELILLMVGTYSLNIHHGNNATLSICYDASSGDWYAIAIRDSEPFLTIIAATATEGIEANPAMTNGSIHFSNALLVAGGSPLETELYFSFVFQNGEYTYTIPEVAGVLTTPITKLSDKASVCIAPESNWNDPELEYPIQTESAVLDESICGAGISCVEVHIIDATLANQECWAYYDINTKEFYAGGAFEEVKIMWDGKSRMIQGTDESPGAVCPSATGWLLGFDEEEGYLFAWLCDGGEFSGTYEMSTECEYSCDEELECPLFTDVVTVGISMIMENDEESGTAKQMIRENDEESETINKSANTNIVISLSDNVIVFLWTIFIVLTLLIVVMCWHNNRKKSSVQIVV